MEMIFHWKPKMENIQKISPFIFQRDREECDACKGIQHSWASKFRDSDLVEDDTLKQIKKILTQKRRHKIVTLFRMMFIVTLPVISLFILVSLNLQKAVENRREGERTLEIMNDIKMLQNLIHSLQNERGSIVRFPDTIANVALDRLSQARKQTDEALKNLSAWPKNLKVAGNTINNKTEFIIFLGHLRERALNGSEVNFENAYSLFWSYTVITSSLNKPFNTLVSVPLMDEVWSLYLSYSLFGQAIDVFGEMRVLGSLFFNWCYLSKEAYSRLCSANGSFSYLIDQIFSLQHDIQLEFDDYFNKTDFELFFDLHMSIIVNNLEGYIFCYNQSEFQRLQQRRAWFSNMSITMDKLILFKDFLLSEISNHLDIRTANIQMEASLQTVLFILVTIAELFLIIFFSAWLNKLLSKMARFASAIQEKSNELVDEKKKANTLLYQMLPYEVVEQLMRGAEVEAKHYSSVTIYFSDIVKFTEISSLSSPMQIVDMLNLLYSGFDEKIELFEVYKVETIGDAYMVSAGVPKIIENHASQLAKLALCLLEFAAGFKIPHLPAEELLLRIGLHTGMFIYLN